MKMKASLVLMGTALLVLPGCKTTETKPVSWKEQSAYLAKVQDPRRFGYSIYQTPRGVEYRDGSRLHPNQAKVFSMQAEKPLRPVVGMRGTFGVDAPLLLDFCAFSSWFEFDLAKKLGAQPISEGKAQLVKQPGEEFPSCPSVVSTVRLGSIFVENPLVNVRMATGPLGLLARGIEKPEIKGVIGWDLLKKFDQIQLDYAGKRVMLTTMKTAYDPDPSFLIATLPLVKYAGVCAVRGLINGKEGLVLLDPAGDFEVATDGAAVVSSIQLDADLFFTAPAISNSPSGIRIGARLLQNYKVTICPQAGTVYFEKLGIK